MSSFIFQMLLEKDAENYSILCKDYFAILSMNFLRAGIHGIPDLEVISMSPDVAR